MKVIIIGAGFTGIQLARSLAARGADVALVENDPNRARIAREQVDCAVFEADGNSPETLASAGADTAAALVALTEDDEVNLITCALADTRWPNMRKIARVRNYDYYERTVETARKRPVSSEQSPRMRPVFGIDCMLNPEVEAAGAICLAAEHGAVGNLIELDGGRGILELAIAPGGALAGVRLSDLGAKLGRRLLLAFDEKPSGAVLPSGATTLEAGDMIGVVASPAELAELAELAGSPVEDPPRSVVVFGAGLIGRFVAQNMLSSGDAERPRGFRGVFSGKRRGRSVAIVDPDPDLCVEAARLIPEARVLCGDIADETFLREEGLDSADLAILASSNHDSNLVMAAYLKSRGVRRTVALTATGSFDVVARKLGVDVAVPLRDTVVDAIAGQLRGSNVLSVHSVCNRRFEIVECGIAPGSAAADRPLRELSRPGEYLLLLASRPGGQFEVPDGNTVLEAGGRVVLVMRAGGDGILSLFGRGSP